MVSKQTFIGRGAPHKQNIDYCVRPNQMPKQMTLAQRERIEDGIHARLHATPAFSYAYFDDDHALMVGLQANQLQAHANVLKRLLEILEKIGMHNPRPGVDTSIAGMI